MLPIDLCTIAGNRYRLDHDPSHKGRGAPDAWLLTIPAQHGHFYPHSAELFGFATKSRQAGLTIAKLPGVEIWQDGADGMNLVFPASQFAKVAAIVRPKRKRQV